MHSGNNPIEQARVRLAQELDQQSAKKAREDDVPTIGPITENLLRIGTTMGVVPFFQILPSTWVSYRQTASGPSPISLAGARLMPAVRTIYTAGVKASGVKSVTIEGREPARSAVFKAEEGMKSSSTTEGTRSTGSSEGLVGEASKASTTEGVAIESAKLTSEEAVETTIERSTKGGMATSSFKVLMQGAVISGTFGCVDMIFTHPFVLKGMFTTQVVLNPTYLRPDPKTIRDKWKVLRTGMLPRAVMASNGVYGMFIGDVIREQLSRQVDNPIVTSIASNCIAGGIVGVINHPIYAMFTKQIAAIPPSPPFTTPSLWSLTKETWRTKGLRGFTPGLGGSIGYATVTLIGVNAADWLATNAVIPVVDTGARRANAFFKGVKAPTVVASVTPAVSADDSDYDDKTRFLSCIP